MKVAELLLSHHHADVNGRGLGGMTAIMAASACPTTYDGIDDDDHHHHHHCDGGMRRREEVMMMMEMLITHGSDLRAVDEEGRTALHHACHDKVRRRGGEERA